MKQKIMDVTEYILRNYETTRSNDRLLVCRVFAHYGAKVTTDFLTVMCDTSLPSVESITRARRKLQEIYPELRAIEKVEIARALKEESYRNGVIC